jgi:hypothetical protein
LKTRSDREKWYQAKDPKKENEMIDKKEKRNPEEMRCATCGIRRRAEANPTSIMARVWKWHTGWCPGWNAYQNALAEAEREVAQAMASM